MPRIDALDVPCAAPTQVTFAYCAIHPTPGAGVLAFLHHVRSGNYERVTGNDPEATFGDAYRRSVPSFAGQLTRALADCHFDAILSPPSSRADADAYRAAFATQHPTAMDLTNAFSRSGKVKSGPGTSLPELIADLAFSPPTGIGNCQTILIVDDVLGDGKTAAAIIERLKPHVPRDATFTLACPLWVRNAP